ncbi:hypothetical protein [Halomonas sp. AOP42-E1-30]|uniref:hypothetical protein n=1 Tax=unclassified Halomonas TaxID=2609666 RepID=UPI001D0336F7|nr:hypothetical protein [Halomonas sp. 3F2F]
MLDFCGLTWVENGIVAQPTLVIPTHIWLKAGGHNHLRITRMIRSLALCHQPDLARTFQQAVIKVVSETSIRYWREAF